MEKKTTDEWLEHFVIDKSDIINPDGWDRKHLKNSWNEKISLKEFQRRLMHSTVKHTPAIDRAFGG